MPRASVGAKTRSAVVPSEILTTGEQIEGPSPVDIRVEGVHCHPSDELRRYAAERIGKVAHYFDGQVRTATVLLIQEHKRPTREDKVVEVTLDVAGHVARTHVTGSEFHAAIDAAEEKIERQVRRLKERLIDRHRAHRRRPVPRGPRDEEEDEEPRITRSKRFELKPMTAEDATMQMEALGHTFYLFIDAESGRPGVVYRRRDGDFGLIEPL